jgi:hypothetical protein
VAAQASVNGRKQPRRGGAGAFACRAYLKEVSCHVDACFTTVEYNLVLTTALRLRAEKPKHKSFYCISETRIQNFVVARGDTCRIEGAKGNLIFR